MSLFSQKNGRHGRSSRYAFTHVRTELAHIHGKSHNVEIVLFLPKGTALKEKSSFLKGTQLIRITTRLSNLPLMCVAIYLTYTILVPVRRQLLPLAAVSSNGRHGVILAFLLSSFQASGAHYYCGLWFYSSSHFL